MKLYGISGLGADKRVFNLLKLKYKVHCVDWMKPYKKESLESYVGRLSELIDTKDEFGLIGVSFGGVVAVELSKIITPKIIILVSSVETSSELGWLYKSLGKLGVNKVIPHQLFKPPKFIINFLFGTQSDWLAKIIDDTDSLFAKWAVNALLNWKNEVKRDNVYRIHGEKDRLLKAPSDEHSRGHMISEAGHFMIVDEASKVSEIINSLL